MLILELLNVLLGLLVAVSEVFDLWTLLFQLSGFVAGLLIIMR
jgi:hypothetical protein